MLREVLHEFQKGSYQSSFTSNDCGERAKGRCALVSSPTDTSTCKWTLWLQCATIVPGNTERTFAVLPAVVMASMRGLSLQTERESRNAQAQAHMTTTGLVNGTCISLCPFTFLLGDAAEPCSVLRVPVLPVRRVPINFEHWGTHMSAKMVPRTRMYMDQYFTRNSNALALPPPSRLTTSHVIVCWGTAGSTVGGLLARTTHRTHTYLCADLVQEMV